MKPSPATERTHPRAIGVRRELVSGLPVEERRRELADVLTAVLEGGGGPPMVLLHGSAEFGALWMRVIPDLVKTHRVIAPDLPGHGASTAVSGVRGTVRPMVWLDELIDQTCASPPVLVGHGLGGALAARFASRHGERVRSLILVDAFGLAPLEPTPSFGRALDSFLAKPTERTRDDLFQQCFADLGSLQRELGERWSAVAAYALQRARSPEMRAALGVLMPAFGAAEIPRADLASITVPTTLIWGRHDLQVPLQVARAASERYGWPLHVVDRAGDDPPLERPEAFLAALRAALATD